MVVTAALGATWLLNRTRTGLALRALASDATAAELLGVQPEKLIRATFFICSGMAGVAGLILSLKVGANPDLGAKYGIWAFAVVVMAGFGSVLGIIGVSLLSGAILGSVPYFLGSASYSNVVLFGLMAVTLVFRPNGLFGSDLRRF